MDYKFFYLLLQAMELLEKQSQLIKVLESQRDYAIDVAKRANETTKMAVDAYQKVIER